MGYEKTYKSSNADYAADAVVLASRMAEYARGALQSRPSVDRGIEQQQQQEGESSRDTPPPSYDSLSSQLTAPGLPPAYSTCHLSKPIAIPATDKTQGSPFLRAYPPILELYHLPKSFFISFLDQLNHVVAGSPPLQVLAMVGGGVGLVPEPTAQLVGMAVQVASELGNEAVASGRTELFLRKANNEVFKPRGLKVEIARLDALAKVAGIPILNDEGKIDKHTPLLPPLESVQAMSSVSAQQRRLDFLSPWIAELDVVGIPEPARSSNPLSRLNTQIDDKLRRSAEEKQLKNRAKIHEKWLKESAKAKKEYDEEMRELQDKEDRVRRKESQKPEKLEEKLRKIEKERAEVQKDYEKDMEEVNKDRHGDDREEKGLRKVNWVIIRNLGDDSGAGPNPVVGEE